MKAFRGFTVLCCSGLLAAVMPLAHAQITGTIYENVPDSGNAGDLAANTASTLPSATFTVGAGGINFSTSNSTTTSVSTWLGNPTFSNLMNGFSPSAQENNTELVLTGSAFLTSGANVFSVGHDDGVVITMPGIGSGTFGNIVNDPGPTSFVLTPFTVNNPGPAGDFTFTLDYAECCGGPAILQWDVNSSVVGSTVPEPGSIGLLGTGLLGLAGMVRRRIFA